MKYIILIIFFVALYFLYVSISEIRLQKAKKAIDKQMKQNENFLFRINKKLDVFSNLLLPFISLSDYKKAKITQALTMLNKNISAEKYTANVLSTTIIFVVVGIILFSLSLFFSIIFAVIGIVLIVIALFNHSSVNKDLYRKYQEKIDAIDYEMPRFAEYIATSVQSQSEIILILSNYKTNDENNVFSKELKKTIIDMKTSSYEKGLIELNNRIGLDSLSMVIKGLLSIVRGNYKEYYFEMIVKELTDKEENELILRATKRPNKANKYMWLLYFAVFICWAIPIGQLAYDYLNQLFK